MAVGESTLGARLSVTNLAPPVTGRNLGAIATGIKSFAQGQRQGKQDKIREEEAARRKESQELALEEKRAERVNSISNELFQGSKKAGMTDEKFQKLLGSINKRISKHDDSRVFGNMTFSRDSVSGLTTLTSPEGEELHLNNKAKTLQENIGLARTDRNIAVSINKFQDIEKFTENLSPSMKPLAIKAIAPDVFAEMEAAKSDIGGKKGLSKSKIFKGPLVAFQKANEQKIKALNTAINIMNKPDSFSTAEEKADARAQLAEVQKLNDDLVRLQNSKNPNELARILTGFEINPGDAGRVEMFAAIGQTDPGIEIARKEEEAAVIKEVQAPLVDQPKTPEEKSTAPLDEAALDAAITSKTSRPLPKSAPAKREARLRPSEKRGKKAGGDLTKAIFGTIARVGSDASEKIGRAGSNTIEFLSDSMSDLNSLALSDKTVDLIKDNKDFKAMDGKVQKRLEKMHDRQQIDILSETGEASEDQAETINIMEKMNDDGVDSLDQDDIDFLEEQIRLNEEPGAKRSLTDMQMFTIQALLGKR